MAESPSSRSCLSHLFAHKDLRLRPKLFVALGSMIADAYVQNMASPRNIFASLVARDQRASVSIRGTVWLSMVPNNNSEGW